MITFAQADIGQLPAGFLKNLMIAMFAFGLFISIFMGTVFMGLQYWSDKKNKKKEEKRDREIKPREIHPQPLPVTVKPQKVSGAVLKALHEELEERVDDHDEEIKRLRNDYTALATDIRTQLSEMPGKIVQDMLNTKKLFAADDKS